MEVTDLTAQPAQRYSFDSIPNDVIIHHIFGYFWFQYWTQHFASVCKRWKQICENATISPKHLRISFEHDLDVGQAIRWVKKYQPTILELNLKNVRGCALDALVGASECIDTLLLDVHDDFFDQSKPSKALSKIRTLFWKPKFSERVFKLFPSLQRLQLQGRDNYPTLSTCKFPVEDLTLINPSNTDWCLKEIVVPKLTIIINGRHRKVFKRIDGHIEVLLKANMTYEQYFKYFGKTKLFSRLASQQLTNASSLLEKEVSYEYESDLVKGYYISYDYPTHQNYYHFNYNSVFESDEYWQNAHQFPFSNKLPVSDRIRFIHMVHNGDVDAAVDLLVNNGTKMYVDYRVARSFFHLLLYPKFNANVLTDTNARAIAKAIIESDIRHEWNLLKTLQQFEKIADLVDWSKTVAHTKDYDLFWAMVDKGAQMPCDIFRHNVYFGWFPNSNTACSEILKELIKRDPMIWYDILATDPNDALNIMKQFNISPTIEKNGKALWHAWCQNGQLPTNDLLRTYINHMDSSGSTLLIAVIEYLQIPHLEIVLKKGADPNKHQQGKLSPLSTSLVTSARKKSSCSNSVLLLFQSGADINLACTFEGRQCSPLMIAVLVGSPLPTISLLIALGARTDYCDDQGRSIVDCVVDSESKYEASDYRTLKWCIKG